MEHSTQALDEPATSSLLAPALALQLTATSAVRTLESCSPAVTWTSEVACCKANLKTTKKRRVGGRISEVRFATEEKEHKTIATADVFFFFCQANHSY